MFAGQAINIDEIPIWLIDEIPILLTKQLAITADFLVEPVLSDRKADIAADSRLQTTSDNL